MLAKAKSIYIFPHILMDGDALGSAAALCAALRARGCDAWILIEDKIPDYLTFLDNGYCTDKMLNESPDVCLAIDCGEENRFPKRADAFNRGKIKACIDHHPTSKPVFDYNYIDPAEAASGEIVYKILVEMKADITKEIGEALFAAITTDTGDFQYVNTTKSSHEIVAKLYDTGMDFNRISILLYQSESMAKVKLHGIVMSRIEIFAGGEAVITEVSQEMLEESGAMMEDTEGIIGKMRAIQGVQIAAMLKEQTDGSFKVTMRAKERGDVSAIAAKYGGGGHVKAAGCTLNENLEESRKIIMREIREALA